MMTEAKRKVLGGIGLTLVVLACYGCWSKQEDPKRETVGGSTDARLVGKWELLDGKFKGTTADFTSGGKVVAKLKHEWMPSEDRIATYSANGTVLRIESGQGDLSDSVTIEVEFPTPDAIVMVVKDGHAFGFDEFGGRWQRVGGPPIAPNFRNSDHGGESFDQKPNDPPALAEAKQRLRSFEQKRAKMEPLLEKAMADRGDLVAKLREVGVNSPADLKGNIRGQRLAESVQKVTTEIGGLEKQIALLDSAILDANSVIRRMEREAAGISEDEMLKLAEQLRDVEDRTDGSRLPITPIDVDAALADAFKERPKSNGPSSGKRDDQAPNRPRTLSAQLIGRWEVTGSRKPGTVEFTKGGTALVSWDDGFANGLGQRGRSATLKYSVRGQTVKLEEPGDVPYRQQQEMTVEVVSADEVIVVVTKQAMSFDWIEGRLKRIK